MSTVVIEDTSFATPTKVIDYQFIIYGDNGVYLVTKEYLGGGAFGSVWKGYRRSDLLPVAVKIVKPRLEMKEKHKKIIKSEISILEKLSAFPQCYPNITCIYDFSEDSNGLFYIVMELVVGGTIDKVNYPTNEMVRKWFIEIATGLNHIHKHGIIHRDIKPVNIMLDSKSNIKIADLGVGCTVVEDPNILTCENIAGTELFLDPRFYLRDSDKIQTATVESDIFSFGQTMFSIITGENIPNFREKSREQMLEEYKIAMGALDDVRNFDAILISLTRRMINPVDANDRPTTDEIIYSLSGKRMPDEPKRQKSNVPHLNVAALVLSQAKQLYKDDIELGIIEEEDGEDDSQYIDLAIKSIKAEGIQIPGNIKELIKKEKA